MAWKLFTADEIIAIHDEAINPGELQGLARDKSIEGALGRVENRLAYGMIDDVVTLAAVYAVAIATGHVFNDANKRTAYRVMRTCLYANGIDFDFDKKEIGDLIISVAQGNIDEDALADWLRAHIAP